SLLRRATRSGLFPYTTLFRSPRKKGKRLPSPLQMAADHRSPWVKTALRLYGKRVRVWYKFVDALWYSSAGQKFVPHADAFAVKRSEEHTSELQSRGHLVCRLL